MECPKVFNMYQDSSAFEPVETDQSDKVWGFLTRMKLFVAVATLPFSNNKVLPYINHTFYMSPEILNGEVHMKYISER